MVLFPPMESAPNERQEIDPEDLPPGCPPGFPYIPTSDPNVLLFEVNDQHFYWIISARQWDTSVTKHTNVYPKGFGFYSWLSKQGSMENADQVKEAGADRGTAVHSGIASLLRGDALKRTEFTDEAWTHLITFVNWATIPLCIVL